MSKKVYLEVTMKMILNVDDGVDIEDVMSGVDVTAPDCLVEDATVEDWKVTDSK